MTPTKRKRLHIEDELPIPGDIVLLATGMPILHRPSDYNTRQRWVGLDEEALVVATCNPRAMRDQTSTGFFDWMYVLLKKDQRLGWVQMNRVVTLLSAKENA